MTVLEPVVAYLNGLRIGAKLNLEKVMAGADRPRKPVLRVMDQLTGSGYLEMTSNEDAKVPYNVGGKRPRNPTWKLLKFPLLDLGKRSPKQRRTERDKVWKAIRDKRKFTRKELARITGSKIGGIASYTQLLEHYGYIKVVSSYKNEKTYCLLSKNAPVKRPILTEMKKN